MVFHLVGAIHATRKALERECPACHHKQVVAKSQRNETVRCAKCDGDLLPKGHHAKPHPEGSSE